MEVSKFAASQIEQKEKKRGSPMYLHSHTQLTLRKHCESRKVGKYVLHFLSDKSMLVIFSMCVYTHSLSSLSVMNSRKMDNVVVSHPVRSNILSGS